MIKADKKHSVYVIKNSINDKVYVGLTGLGVAKRFGRHLRQARSGSECILHRAMRKHGFDSFWAEEVHSGLTCEDAQELEIKEIEARGANGPSGYNIAAGGGSGVSLRPSLTQSRRSKAAKASWLKSEKWQASIHSPERLQKISAASKLSHANPEYRKQLMDRHAKMVEASKAASVRAKAVESFKKSERAIAVLCANGMRFDTAADAARWASSQTGKLCHLSNIITCAKGRRKTAYGFGWSLDERGNG